MAHKDTAARSTFADHEVITPENKLRKHVSHRPLAPGEEDPVARDAGVTEFLAKPISAKGLYQRILNVVANPRPFIKTKTYFGPDRRRNTNNAYIGPERRVGGEVEVMQQPSLLDKARSAV